MEQRRRLPRDADDGAFPIQYLLPVQYPLSPSDMGEGTNASESVPEDFGDDYDELNLYRQAVPLLHPHSTATARTIGKMLGNNKIATRILQRNQAITTDPSTQSPAPNTMRRLRFLRTCEDMFMGFDPSTKQTKKLPLHRMRLLLHYYGLDVDDVAYRQWEQSLPAECREVSLVAFIDACTKWSREQFLIDHYSERRQQQHTAEVTGGVLQPSSLGKCQSAPQLLHPFDALARQNDKALAFSYKHCAQSPQRQRKTQGEQAVSKSQALISATQQLRRNTKMLTRLQSKSALSTDTTSPSPAPATHDRLHEERLARHILQRCGSQTLAPSNRRKSSLFVGGAPSPTNHARNVHTIKLKQAEQKLMRQYNTETAKAFSASVAMISRHVHNEELRDLREIAFEKQVAVVDTRKQLRRLQNAHCKALEQEKTRQQMRDVVAMKTLAEEEGEMTRQYLQSREQQLRLQKSQFTLSSSSSTLFQQPPEILAAKATAKTGVQKKRLQMMEKEHLDHMRSIQILDYTYDKRRAMEEASEPKADATLLELEVKNLPEAQETVLATQELWQQIVDTCQDNNDLTPLIPPPNSPPAALRYFATNRPTAFLPPFTASTVTPSPISKVP